MAPHPCINIISYSTGSGLDQDIHILLNLLKTSGYQAQWTKRLPAPGNQRSIPRLLSFGVAHLKRWLHIFWSKLCYRQPPYTLNLFIERIDPRWLASARYNWFIPNQEWFFSKEIPFLEKINLVVCKTHHCQDLFDKLECTTEYISFTSQDTYDSTIPKQFDRFFHAPGRSLAKGTKAVVDLWLKHPEWPHLTLLQNPRSKLGILTTNHANLEYRFEQVSRSELQKIQNACGIHLCPSTSEGFGHYINEALASGAVVVTTDGPPMNELVTSDRGVVVPWRDSQPRRLGTDYFIDSQALEAAIESLIQMSHAEKEALGQRARAWYLANDRFFRQRFLDILRDRIPEFRDPA